MANYIYVFMLKSKNLKGILKNGMCDVKKKRLKRRVAARSEIKAPPKLW